MGKIKYSKEGSTGRILISNLDKKNAISLEMWNELAYQLDQIEKDKDLRVLLIEGEGDNFSAGADISEFSDLRQGKMRLKYDKAIYSAGNKLKLLLIPTIAHIRGFCLGGGFALALKCDFRIAEKNAVFALPAVKRGLGYNKKSIKELLDVVGLNNTRDILLTGRKIEYKEALEMGLVLKSNISSEEAVESYIQKLSENAPLSIKAIKAGLLDIAGENYAGPNSEELVDKCFFSEDYIEGNIAFKEKRKTNFKGK